METNKLYECTVIIDGGLQDEAILAAMELVKRVITEKGGTISNVLEIGRRKTAYRSRRKPLDTTPISNLTRLLMLLQRLKKYSVMRNTFCAT